MFIIIIIYVSLMIFENFIKHSVVNIQKSLRVTSASEIIGFGDWLKGVLSIMIVGALVREVNRERGSQLSRQRLVYALRIVS